MEKYEMKIYANFRKHRLGFFSKPGIIRGEFFSILDNIFAGCWCKLYFIPFHREI